MGVERRRRCNIGCVTRCGCKTVVMGAIEVTDVSTEPSPYELQSPRRVVIPATPHGGNAGLELLESRSNLAEKKERPGSDQTCGVVHARRVHSRPDHFGVNQRAEIVTYGAMGRAITARHRIKLTVLDQRPRGIQLVRSGLQYLEGRGAPGRILIVPAIEKQQSHVGTELRPGPHPRARLG